MDEHDRQLVAAPRPRQPRPQPRPGLPDTVPLSRTELLPVDCVTQCVPGTARVALCLEKQLTILAKHSIC